MAIPVTKVEFGFTQSAGAYVYQDITSFVRSVDITRGVQRETDTFQAGACTVTLDNNLRTFDPSYASSPYYGEVKPQAAVRITSGNIVVFVGFVDNWQFDYTVATDATATLTAYDSISRLSYAKLKAVTWTAEQTDVRVGRVLDKSEIAWPASARQISPGSIGMGADFVDDGTSAWDYIQQIAQTEGGAAFVAGNGDVAFKGQASAEVPSTATTYRYNLATMPSIESATLTAGGATWTGTRSVGASKYGAASIIATSQFDPTDPTGGAATGVKYYDSTSGRWVKNNTYTVSAWVYVGGSTVRTYTMYVSCMDVGIDFMSDFKSVSVSGNASSGWQRISVTYTPKASKPLLIWIPDNFGAVYVDGLLIEQSPYLADYFDGTNKPANTASQTFTSAWNGTANLSQSTLTTVTTYSPSIKNAVYLSDNGGTAVPYTDVRVVYASETLYNNTQVVSTAGTASQSNAALGTAYGIRTLTIDPALTANLTQSGALANYLLSIYDNPQLRFDAITVALEGVTAEQQASVLNADIWSAANITYTPSAVGSAITAYQRIVGVNHSITPESHRVSFNLAEFGNKFRLDSANFGVLGTNILGY